MRNLLRIPTRLIQLFSEKKITIVGGVSLIFARKLRSNPARRMGISPNKFSPLMKQTTEALPTLLDARRSTRNEISTRFRGSIRSCPRGELNAVKKSKMRGRIRQEFHSIFFNFLLCTSTVSLFEMQRACARNNLCIQGGPK